MRDTAGSRALLWSAFAVVHVLVAVLGFVLPNQPMGDVYLVYEPWAAGALQGAVPGIAYPFVYPQLAIVPMLAAQLLAGPGGYVLGWALLVTALDAVAFGVLVGAARSRGRVRAAWFWLGFALLLGPVGMYRIDAITVALAVLGLLLLVHRPAAAALLLSVGAWIKVWPAALVAAAIVAVRRRATVLAVALAVSALVAAAVFVVGGGAHLAGFIGTQTGRGIQLEAPVATWYLWRAVAGIEGSFIFYDPEILTFQVAGPEVDPLIAAMTPALAAAAVAVLGLGALKAVRGAPLVRLLPPLMLAVVLVLIVFNKVGSPQFQTWLIAPLVLWLVLDRRRARVPAVLALVVAGLTQAVYPLTYGLLLSADPVGTALLTARNAASLALLVVVLAALVRMPAPGPRPRQPARVVA
ncbi:glycosyltransferase 87 family protein [Microbacterium sp. LRZ72]|uniref:glycosyltransferase 87 family protein n=1 Tax=Microbacterium sp. LRZ72 TaxID=2942481 RepID=UPI0029B08D7D|nr:glycosyltransferase 87 family protein [Microbacterium sp. LRZ72]MDX2377085.1 glycosyltransferase 87 family protein [Microbacterium sp. LRZ72]